MAETGVACNRRCTVAFDTPAAFDILWQLSRLEGAVPDEGAGLQPTEGRSATRDERDRMP